MNLDVAHPVSVFATSHTLITTFRSGMAHTLVYPGKYFFYPLGNTPAVCLTRDIPPEEPANVLLLGCGDPRSVLFTIFSEPQKKSRALDFTCYDIEPAVLAHNVLLLTLLADSQLDTNSIWNIDSTFTSMMPRVRSW